MQVSSSNYDIIPLPCNFDYKVALTLNIGCIRLLQHYNLGNKVYNHLRLRELRLFAKTDVTNRTINNILDCNNMHCAIVKRPWFNVSYFTLGQ